MNIDRLDCVPQYHRQAITGRPNNPTFNSEYTCTKICILLISAVVAVMAFCFYFKTHSTPKYSENRDVGLLHKGMETYHEKYDFLLQELAQQNDKIAELTKWRREADKDLAIPHTSELDARIEQALMKYDADKIGLFDYAANYAGGQIVSFSTCPYPTNKVIVFLNVYTYQLDSNPDAILQPDNMPGNCFVFTGSEITIRIKLGAEIRITNVTIDHWLLALQRHPESVPRDFEIYGLKSASDTKGVFLGNGTRHLNKAYQTFGMVEGFQHKFKFVELKILNNYGNKKYTCLYRFRVHSI